MKKLYLLLIMLLTLSLASCEKKAKHKDLDDVTKYVSSLDSYELKAELVMKRYDKEVNMNVLVNYLKPSFYKVTFTNDSGNEQIVVKNNGGVYVLTPSLNKEFKFDSQWPLNSSHAYILETIIKDIENDTEATYIIENDILQAEAKVNKVNSDVVKMKFYYDLVNNKPLRTVFLNSQNEEKITVTVNDFSANKSTKEEIFNNKLIMNEKTNLEGKEPETPTILLTVGHIIDGTSLVTQELNDDVAILCYSGEKNYTIVAEAASVFTNSIPIYEFDNYEVTKYGVMVFNEYGALYYHNSLEVAIYSSDLTIDEMVRIAEEINFG